MGQDPKTLDPTRPKMQLDHFSLDLLCLVNAMSFKVHAAMSYHTDDIIRPILLGTLWLWVCSSKTTEDIIQLFSQALYSLP